MVNPVVLFRILSELTLHQEFRSSHQVSSIAFAYRRVLPARVICPADMLAHFRPIYLAEPAC
jgi:hypothetical protein